MTIKGLRTQESERFKRFFKEVQGKAQTTGHCFFLDTGEEKGTVFKEMELDDLFGWLIPNGLVDSFERDFKTGAEGEKWEAFATWCIPVVVDDELVIEFKNFI